MTRPLPILALLAAILWHAPAPVAAAQETPTPAPLADELPDRCEPNDTAQRACVLPLDAVSGPFTFLPDGDVDVYSLNLGDVPGLALEVTVRTTEGLNLRTTITRAGSPEPLTVIASPAISATLAADLSGWLVMQVENRAPQLALGESYRVELRRVLPPAPHANVAPPEAPDPDRLENNWSPATAAPVGVGVVYDLNFTCPVSWGCDGGDHDYLAVPVKAGVRYLMATMDLGPGVDTVIDLFWGDDNHPVAANDDAQPGAAFLSALRWTAPANGVAIVRIGPRTGGLAPAVFDNQAGAYRFVIALAASDLAGQIEDRIAAQTGEKARGGGTPAASTPSATAAPAPSADAPTGPAVVEAESTVLREAPVSGAAIETLPQEAAVTLLGQASGAWVRVQPASGVVPGWVYGPDLRAMPSDSTPPDPAAPTTAPDSTPQIPPMAGPPAVAGAAEPRVTRLEPAPLPAAPPPAARVPLDLTIQILTSTGDNTPRVGRATPTPTLERGVAKIRVQLISAFGDVLAEAITPASGNITLRRDLAAGAAAFVRIPALGVQIAADPAQPVLTITVPKGDA